MDSAGVHRYHGYWFKITAYVRGCVVWMLEVSRADGTRDGIFNILVEVPDSDTAVWFVSWKCDL